MLRAISILASMLLFLIADSADGAEVLFQPAPAHQKLSRKATDMLKRITSSPTTKSIQRVEVNPSALRNTGEITVILATKLSATFAGPDRVSVFSNDFTWSGLAKAGDLGSKSLPPSITVTVEGGNLSATIRTATQIFEVLPLGDGSHVLIEVDVNEIPPDHGSLHPLGPTKQTRMAASRRATTDTSVAVIRVLVVITPRANRNIASMHLFAQSAIDEANVSYRNSSVRARLELADVRSIDYVESHNHATDLARLISRTDGRMDEVHALRDRTKADVVVLIVDDGVHDCGLANVSGGPDQAFAINHYGCTRDNLSLPHEIGHILGACHDPANSSGCPSAPYARGYRNIAERRRSIMAYPCPKPIVCVRQQEWSRPPDWGTASRNFNAKVIDANAPSVSRYR